MTSVRCCAVQLVAAPGVAEGRCSRICTSSGCARERRMPLPAAVGMAEAEKRAPMFRPTVFGGRCGRPAFNSSKSNKQFIAIAVSMAPARVY